MKLKFNGFLVLLLVLITQITFAQDRTVTGLVTDESGLPIPGANVLVKGTSNGTQTDFDGKFKIQASGSQVLVVTYVGMKTQEVKATSATLKIKLISNAVELEGVIITSLGIKKKKDEITSSTQLVSNKEITQASNPNVLRSLAGKVSGLQINNSSNGINGKTRITLRGTRSLTGSNEALVVIDNAISSASALQQLPPEIVESVNVIKGAQGAALYGDQGVNGVIIVTTKKGSRNDKLTINYNSSIDFETISFLPKKQLKYGQGWDGTQYNDENGGWGALLDGSLVPTGLPQADGNSLLLPYIGIKDSFKKFYKTGTTYQNGFTLNAGGENGYALFSANNQKTGFIVEGDDSERNSFIFKAGKKIGKFNLDGNINYVADKSSQTNAENNRGGILLSLLQGASNIPIESFANSGPGSGWTGYYKNPYWVRDNNRLETNQTFLNAISTISYELNKNIDASYTANVQMTNRSSQSHANGYVDETYSTLSQSSEYYSNQSATRNFYGDLLINFKYKLNDDLSLKFNVGNNIQDRTYRITSQGGTNLDIPGWYNIKNVLNPANPLTLDNRYVRSRRYAFFGNIDLGYKEYAFMNITGRQDGNSTLSSKNQTYFYPSLGFSFIPTKAFESIKGDVLNYAKLSASIVRVGNTSPINPYDINDVHLVPTGFPFGNTGSYVINRNPTDNNIKPEFVTTKELNTNLGFFNNRITLDASIYRADVKDLITAGSTSSATGFQTYQSNVGGLKTTGLEIDLGFVPIKSKDFTWEARASYSTNKTIVTALNNTNQLNLFTANSTGGYGGFTVSNIAAGVFAEVGEEFPLIKGTSLVRDGNGNVIIGADGMPTVDPNFKTLGKVTPDYILGFTNTFQYKGLKLVAVLDYRTGHKVISETKYNLTWNGHIEESAAFDRDNGFIYPNSVIQTSPGVYTQNTTVYSAAGYGGNGVINYYGLLANTGENNVIDATALKVRELALSYELPSSLIKKTGFSAIRVGVNARNPFIVLAKENKGYTDPEADNTYNSGVTNSALRASGNTSLNGQGYSGTGQYPSTKTIGFSLNVTF